jgi:hypothetical protein
MKIKVYVVDLEIPRRVKRWSLLVGVPLGLLFGVVAIAYASLTTFKAGDPLSATTMNANFADLNTRLTAVESLVAKATADGGYSLGATYCGSTAATEGAFSGPGALTGYAAAKAQCQSVSGCSATAAHMCTTDEIARTEQLSVAIPVSGWYSTALSYADWTTNRTGADDCNAWQWNTSWNGVDGGIAVPFTGNCNTSLPILCCN